MFRQTLMRILIAEWKKEDKTSKKNKKRIEKLSLYLRQYYVNDLKFCRSLININYWKDGKIISIILKANSLQFNI